MGSSCSSGSKKEKCSKKKKLPCLPFRLESNGANPSPRGSNASNSSAYAYQKSPSATAAGEGEGNGAEEGAAPPAASATTAHRPAPIVRPKVERMDSHSGMSVSSPMSPNQLTRQPTKEGGGVGGEGGGRLDLRGIPEDVRALLTGVAPDEAVLGTSPRSLTVVVCRNGVGAGAESGRLAEALAEYVELRDRVLEPLEGHCRSRGYEMRALLMDEDALHSDWSWVADESPTAPPVLLLLVASECRPLPYGVPLPSRLPRPSDASSLAPYYESDDNAVDGTSGALLLVREPSKEEDRSRLLDRVKQLSPRDLLTGFGWLSEAVCASPRLRSRSVCVWKRLLQSPFELTAQQQRLLEGADDNKLIKCTLRWKDHREDEEGDAGPEPGSPFRLYLKDLCSQLGPVLMSTADAMLDEAALGDPLSFTTPRYLGVSRQLYSELVEQTRVAQELLRGVPPAAAEAEDAVLAAVRSYVTSDSPWPLVVHGAAGSGKSRVVAQAVQRCVGRWLPDAHLVFRFAHQSAHSYSVERMLTSVLEQCCLLLGEPPLAGVQAMDLPSLLQRLAPSRPLVVMLDGLDFLDEPSLLLPSDGAVTSPSSSLQWLPSQLPANVRLVLTVTEPSPLADHLRHFLSFEERGEAGFVHVPPLKPEEAAELLRFRLLANGRRLTPEQQLACALDVAKCPTPKYAILAADCASGWHSSRAVEDLQLAADLRGQAHSLLGRLEGELDSSLVRAALCYLLLSKHGLSEDELAALLRDHSAPAAEVGTAWSATCLALVRALRRHLTPTFLRSVVVGDRALLRCCCPILRDACRSRYLGDDETTSGFVATLRQFWEAAKLREGAGEQRLNRRKLDELPRLCGVPADRFLFDWEWVFAKLVGSSVLELLDDAAQASPATDETERLRRLLREAAVALAHDGRQLFTQVHARLKLPPNSEKQFPNLHRLLELCATAAPENCLLCPAAAGCLSSPDEEELPSPASGDETEETGISTAAAGPTACTLHRIKDNPAFVVMLRPAADEVTVWNVYEQREERRLRGVIQPRDVRFADGRRAVVLCGRELCVYELDSCVLEMRVKGVMNQTMAYYDLHDASHVVALSRNRMYVNMTQLVGSGDCVATFKVGEDRFLNSLLVSANGRVCVCGDETQKPFPLLVWDLASRKLLYDLRIPYHDFVTSLSAITSDGHYVVCVCQEVSDPGSPNFIIVYDLQNGTLFKKWKPEISTCSVAISSEGGCVVTGLQDTSVLVWNLTTGACSFKLLGHTAPITFIRMDESGTRCVTADILRGRDPAIFLWDLSTGACLSSFVSDQQIESCELTQDGRAVVLALSNRPEILTLVLVKKGGSLTDATPPPVRYGNPENLGKRVDLRETAG